MMKILQAFYFPIVITFLPWNDFFTRYEKRKNWDTKTGKIGTVNLAFDDELYNYKNGKQCDRLSGNSEINFDYGICFLLK